jgi:hypothetical protein
MKDPDQHLLVAYNCQMKYLRRNNPILKEKGNDLSQKIKDDVEPNISTCEMLNELMSLFEKEDGVHFQKSRSVLGFESYRQISGEHFNGIDRYVLNPLAGRTGMDFMVQDFGKSGWQPESFGGENAALFRHDVFVYGDGPIFTIIFHRIGNSSCKTVFMNAVDKCYRNKGIHLEMNPTFSENDRIDEGQIDISELNLVTTSSVPRNDIADTEKKGNKIEKVKESEMSLYLQSAKYSPLKRKLMDFKKKFLGKPDPERAIASFKEEVGNGLKDNDYSDAYLRVYIGAEKKLRTISLTDFLDLALSRDVTSDLCYREDGRPTPESLLAAADNYYHDLALGAKK